MKVQIYSWNGSIIEGYGPEPREFTGEEILALSEKYDVMIHNVKIEREKGSFRSHQDRHIQLYDEVKILFLDEKGGRCTQR